MGAIVNLGDTHGLSQAKSGCHDRKRSLMVVSRAGLEPATHWLKASEAISYKIQSRKFHVEDMSARDSIA